ncbi:hypothetical protein Micbo1qcDRAFT_171869 [Microdochium bolleyi]|uniref:Uncharacterized protein n=1 Tax=Microdochium bolleyi TaxID=196109 RepID=A0A136JEH3_9PEZI|nr:hypothetical protein Micbo1qcDRAFT_171869 [Microdochium bolleyi]
MGEWVASDQPSPLAWLAWPRMALHGSQLLPMATCRDQSFCQQPVPSEGSMVVSRPLTGAGPSRGPAWDLAVLGESRGPREPVRRGSQQAWGLCDEAILARNRRGTGARVARSAFLAWAALTWTSQGEVKKRKKKSRRAGGDPRQLGRDARTKCGSGVMWRRRAARGPRWLNASLGAAGQEPTTAGPSQQRREFLLFLGRGPRPTRLHTPQGSSSSRNGEALQGCGPLLQAQAYARLRPQYILRRVLAQASHPRLRRASLQLWLALRSTKLSTVDTRTTPRRRNNTKTPSLWRDEVLSYVRDPTIGPWVSLPACAPSKATQPSSGTYVPTPEQMSTEAASRLEVPALRLAAGRLLPAPLSKVASSLRNHTRHTGCIFEVNAARATRSKRLSIADYVTRDSYHTMAVLGWQSTVATRVGAGTGTQRFANMKKDTVSRHARCLFLDFQ